MYHSFFIHSSVDGHLGCFHVLAIVISAVMNIGHSCNSSFLGVYVQQWDCWVICLVKAMVFPVVMYGYESWTVKKAEH